MTFYTHLLIFRSGGLQPDEGRIGEVDDEREGVLLLHAEREIFGDNALVQIPFIVLMILVDWPCAMGV